MKLTETAMQSYIWWTTFLLLRLILVDRERIWTFVFIEAIVGESIS